MSCGFETGEKKRSGNEESWAWGRPGKLPGEFARPGDIAIGIDGSVYVADCGNDRIQRFWPDGTFMWAWGSHGSDDGQLHTPQGLAVGICPIGRKSVLNAMTIVDPLAAFPPGVLPMCAEYAMDEHVYVADGGNCRMQTFTVHGAFIRKWGRPGPKDGEFWGPSACVMDVNGVIHVTDIGNERVQSFHSDGAFIRKWGTEFRNVASIAMSRANLFVVYNDREHIHVKSFSLDGTIEPKWDRRGGKGVFTGTVGQRVMVHDGLVYVASRGGVHIFLSDGSVHRSWMLVADGLKVGKTGGIALGVDHVVYVADCANHRIVCTHLRPL